MSEKESDDLYLKIESLTKDPTLGALAEAIMVFNVVLVQQSKILGDKEQRISALEKQVSELTKLVSSL